MLITRSSLDKTAGQLAQLERGRLRTAPRHGHGQLELDRLELEQLEQTAGGIVHHDPRPELAAAPGLLLVVPCSRGKLDRPAPAGQLYTGPLYLAAARAAAAVAELAELAGIATRTRILSARYGLVDPATVLPPYNVRMGDVDAIPAAQLERQAALHAQRAHVAVALTPNAYTAALAAAWPGALVAPLAGSAGIGVQKARLAAIARAPGELCELIARELVRP